MKIAIVYSESRNDLVTDIRLFGLGRLLKNHELSFLKLNHTISNLSNFDLILPYSPILGEEAWSKFLEMDTNRILVYGASIKTSFLNNTILKELINANKLSLEAPITLDFNVPIVGQASLFATSYETKCIEAVFSPLESSERWLTKKLDSIYKLYSEKRRTLFIATNPRDLSCGAMPGISTLISPRFYDLIIKSIASSKRVITGKIDIALMAIGNSIPVVFLTKEPNELIKYLKIPTLILKNDSNPSEIVTQIDKFFDEYNLNDIRKDALVNNVKSFFNNHGITIFDLKARPHITKEKKLVISSISDSSYSGLLCGLIENILDVHKGKTSFHILCLDIELKKLLLEKYKEIDLVPYLLEELWTKEELPHILNRSIGFRAFSSKPRLIKHALLNENDFVLYTDCDVYFFESPIELSDYLRENTILLFPHWNDEFPEARLDGLYNAGMVGVRPHAKAFLDWWAKLCLHCCSIDEVSGVVGDQGYLDFSHLFFENVIPYKLLDHNVARWNIKSLGISIKAAFPPKPVLFNDKSIKSYHAAFMDDIGLFEKKYAWDQFFAFTLNNNSLQTYKNTISLQRLYWKELNRLMYLNVLLEKFFKLKFSPTQKFWLKGLGASFLKILGSLKRKPQKLEQKKNFWYTFQGETLGNKDDNPRDAYKPTWDYSHKDTSHINYTFPDATSFTKCSNERL